MAASTSGRLGGLFLLLTIISLQIPSQIIAQGGRSGVQVVTAADLDKLAETNEHVLAFFHDGSCTTDACKDAKTHVELAEKENDLPSLKVVSIHSDAKAKELGIDNVPNLVFYHNGSPNIYPGGQIEIEAIIEWIEGPPEKLIIALDDTNFEHLTQAASGATTGDWLVVFYKSTCSRVMPTLRAVANRLKGRVVVAHVDMTYSPQLVKRFKVTNCPALKFFRLGNMYDFNLPKQDVQTLVKFAEGWYKNSKSSKVPVELSPFDGLVEFIVLSLKEAVEDNHLFPMLVAGGMVTLVITVLCAYCFLRPNREKTE